MLGEQRRVVDRGHDEAVAETLRVLERDPVVVAGDRVSASDASRLSQKSSASSEATRHCTVCTIPAPARPRRTPGYSKNVMSLPGVPASSA